MMGSEDRRVVACNMAEGTRIAVRGARAFVVLTNRGNAHERIQILVRSRSGRWVCKWERIERLCRFRPKTIPPGAPRYGDERLWDVDAEGTCVELEEARQRML